MSLLLALVAAAATTEGAYLLVVSRPAFRTWLKGDLERSGRGVISFGPIRGNPFRMELVGVAFESHGSSNVRKLHAPVAYATLQWWRLLSGRTVGLKSLVLEDAEVEVKPEGGRSDQIAFPLPAERIVLRRSVVRVFKLSGWTVVLTAVNAVLEQSGAGDSLSVSATLESGRVTVGRLVIQDLKGDARVANRALDLVVREALVHGGSFKASGSMLLDPPQPLKRMVVAVSGMSVLSVLRGLGYSERFEGRARLEASFRGRLTPFAPSLAGTGRLRLERFVVRADLPRVNLFNIAPVLTQLKRVDRLVGGAQLELNDQRVGLTGLVLQRPDLRITGTGYLTLGGELSADCRAFLRGELAKGVPPMVRASLENSQTGELIVPFKVGTTLAEPKVDIGGVVKGTFLHPFKRVFD
ncbi:MAG TPA: AsmA-like C-terminal region-containing protein [Vicinamibacteria bacterium]|nr:AsmA-like C-terminal region-containing protein [Vicinamibacteria bacterium]